MRIGSVRYRLMDPPAVSLEAAEEAAATGDIWLFRGTSLADRAIRTFTNAPVNHVGMVVAIDDLPPLLWHAELGRSLPDVWTGNASATCSSTCSSRPSTHGARGTASERGCGTSTVRSSGTTRTG
jgi:hypothetical protein